MKVKGFFSTSPTKSQVPRIPRCGKCGLYKEAISPKMEVTGKGQLNVMFVGEAPGEQEDRQGEQLVGDAGQLLRHALENINADLEDCWKTNAVICRPPGNKIEPSMITNCRPNLLKAIKVRKPNVIIILGKSALESLLFQEWKKDLGPLGRWIGWTIPSPQYNAWLCPTYHPSYIMRMGEDELLMKIFERHLSAALDLEGKKPKPASLDKLKEKVEIILDPTEAQVRMSELSRKRGVLAFDYETNGLKPDKDGHKIVSVSFCLNGKETFACMVDDGNKLYLSRILKSTSLRKVASNMKFEERWTRAILGHGVRKWAWDTMLAAHCIDNRPKITSIKFQAYIHLGLPDYDSHIAPYLKAKTSNGLNTIEQVDRRQLLIYNGLDSLLEYMVMVKQRKMLK